MLMIFSKMEPYWASFMIFASLAISFVALSCPTQSSTKGNNTTMMTQVDAEAQLMDSIKKACVLLSKQSGKSGNPQTILEEANVFAQQFGKLKPSEVNRGYYVEPSNKLLQKIFVPVRDTHFFLELYPLPQSGLSIQSFEKVFGAYEKLPLRDWNTPERIAFDVNLPELSSRSCLMFIDYYNMSNQKGMGDVKVVEIAIMFPH
jgi:hypothetical protein